MSQAVEGSERFRGRVHALLRRAHRVRLAGAEALRGLPPAVVAVRHTGWFRHGGVVAAAALPRPVTFVGAAFMLGHPLLGAAVRRYGGVFVNAADLQGGRFLDDCAAVLRRGRDLGVMVDGGEADRVRGAVKPGAAWLAHRLGVEIVPVRVEFSPAGRARVRVLAPQPPPPRADRAALRAATARLARLLA